MTRNKKYPKVEIGSRPPVHYKFAVALRRSAVRLRTGRLLCIDPGSSKFGWAIYEGGILTASGSDQTQGKHMQDRLKWLVRWITETFEGMHFDILILEQPYEPSASTIPSLYNKVMKSIGVFQALLPYDYLLDIRPSTWQSYASGDWIKGDESDAVEMGRAVLDMLDVVDGSGSGTRREEAEERSMETHSEYETMAGV